MRISQLRNEMGIGKIQLGCMLKVDINTVSGFKSGNVEPYVKTLIELSKIFNVTIDYIVCNCECRNFGKDREVEYLSFDQYLLKAKERGEI